MGLFESPIVGKFGFLRSAKISGSIKFDLTCARTLPVNPFATYAQRERERRFGELSIVEKVVLHGGRACLSTRETRLLVFFYIAGMHVLVFAVLWLYTHVHHAACPTAKTHSHHASHERAAGDR